jgi:hypothetical protein
MNRIRILFIPIGPHKSKIQTFPRWSLNVKQKQPGYLSHQQIAQTVFVSFRILLDLAFIHFFRQKLLWYQKFLLLYICWFIGDANSESR